MMKRNLAIAWYLIFSVCSYGTERLIVPQLPQSPYGDTEISTNIAFRCGDPLSRTFSMHIELDCSPTNTLQLAFGTDSDGNGVLDWIETSFLLGWRCGGWFFRDKAAGSSMFCQMTSGMRRLDWNLRFDASGRPRSLSVFDFNENLAVPLSEGMFSRDWNAMRVTMRGALPSAYNIEECVSSPGFILRTR